MFKIICTIARYAATLIVVSCFCSSFASAASDINGQAVLLQDKYTRYKAEVVSVQSQRVGQIPGTDTPHTYQNITVKILNKDKVGQQVQIENDYRMMVPGDTFYLDYTVRTDGEALYIVGEVYRLNAILFLAGLFLVLVVWLGGWQGVRSLLALVGSFLAIVYILFPGIIAGYNPVLISSLLAIGVLFFIMYVTHGFNRMTTAAFLGCLVTILITIVLSYLAVLYTKLSGFSSDDAVYLNFNTAGTINFQGLLLGGIIIGVMGIIDDIAITQASIVAELRGLKEKLSTQEIFGRAMKVGRDHMGAVVNSLVLAYTGVALPLLLLIYTSDVPLVELLNQEILATELVRTLVGSIGLVLAVPISTILAVLVIKKGDHAHAHGGHSHSH
jgi:uncharacterized membrane protein